MTALDNTPANINFLSPVSFEFMVKRLPTVNFFVQTVDLPGITMGTINMPTPLKAYPIPSSSSIAYGDLTVSFKIDEDMKNYREIFNWITENGSPDNLGQYKPETVLSDASLIVNTSAKSPNILISISDAFPVSLSSVRLTTTDAQITYIEASASFKFTNYTFETIV